MGIICGLLIDGVFYKIYCKNRHNLLFLMMVQILVNIIVMYWYIRIKKIKSGLDKWEFSLLAVSFPGFFFSVQYHLFERIKEISTLYKMT